MGLLSSMLSQLCVRYDSYHDILSYASAVHELPATKNFIQCLKDLLEFPGQAAVSLIVDPNLRICVTSRPQPDVKVVLEPFTFRSVSMHDETGKIADIENYIESVVNADWRTRKWKPRHKGVVIDVLTRRALNGM